jgi:hypothetical protein
MILEALTIMQDPNGIDIATIASFMEVSWADFADNSSLC